MFRAKYLAGEFFSRARIVVHLVNHCSHPASATPPPFYISSFIKGGLSGGVADLAETKKKFFRQIDFFVIVDSEVADLFETKGEYVNFVIDLADRAV